MNVFDIYFSLKGNVNKKLGIFDAPNINYKGASQINDYSKIASVMTAVKILAENKARLKVEFKKDSEVTKHYLSKIINRKPNSFQNANRFWQEIEYNRNYYGNSFAKIIRNPNTGSVKELVSIHPNSVEGFKIVNNTIYLVINISSGKDTINYNDILHFTTPLYQQDSIFTLSPLKAVTNSASIISKAGDTINSFYSNNAVSPLVLESELPQANQIKQMKEYADEFSNKHTGTSNAGGIIPLPPSMKLKPLSTSFVDSQLIETMKFSRAEIASIFGVPLYMLDGYADANDSAIEQQTLEFKNLTLSPILSIYKEELEFKLLTSKDLDKDITISFDTDVLIDADLKTKTNAYALQVSKGIASPNEAIKKLGNKPINSEIGDKHYIQKQNEFIEDYYSTKNENNNKKE